MSLTRVIRAAALPLGIICSGAALLPATAQAGHPLTQAAAQQPIDELDPSLDVSGAVVELAGWVIAAADNSGHPFAIIDKSAGQILVFDAAGRSRGLAPALLGSALGDHSAPGVAESALKDIPLEDRTTPAGRFLAAYGPALGGETALWVDYDSAVSIHPLSTTAPAEKRPERLATPTAGDNRITHGCINVSPNFYDKVVKPAFAKGGLFYILPEEITLAEAFPGFVPSGVEPAA